MKINYEIKVAVAAKVKDCRDKDGDIFFDTTEDLQKTFTEMEIALMAIRFMRNSESSKDSNKKRAATDREFMKAAKAIAQKKFNKKLDDCSIEEKAQVAQALGDAIKG